MKAEQRLLEVASRSLASEDPRQGLKPVLCDGRDAALLLSVCPRTILNLEKRGLLKSVKILRRRLYRVSDLMRIARNGDE